MDGQVRECRRFRFTQKAIESLPQQPPDARSREAEYSDVEVVGLRVIVSKTGRKFFDFRYRFNKRKRVLRVGEFPSVSLKDARQRVHEYKNGLSRGIDPLIERGNLVSAISFAEFADKEFMPYAKANKRSWKTDLGKLKNDLIPLWGKLPLSAISTRDVQGLYSRVRTENSPTYANRYLALIGRMFTLAIQWGHLPDGKNPTRGIKKYRENGARERFLARDEIDRLLAALDARPERATANAIKFLLFTGMRRGEAIGLKWENVDLEKATVFLPKTKSGKTRTVMLNVLAKSVLEEMAALRTKGHPYVFPGKTSKTHLAEPRKTFENVKSAAGLDNLHLHDLRHTFASLAINQGASLYEVQKLLGHASSQMTQRYAHLADESLRAVTDDVAKEITHAVA
jgi:integrase